VEQGWKGEVRAHQRAGDRAALQTLSGATPQRDIETCPVPSPGWREPFGNKGSRKMTVQDRTRLISLLVFYVFIERCRLKMKNGRGKTVDMIATIVMIGAFVVSIYAMTKTFYIGLAILVVSLLLFCAAVGVAELLNLMQSIDVRLGNLEHELEQQRHSKLPNIKK